MVNLSPVVGEFVGTFVLIVLGNGVVAGALLNRSKAQHAGWISITAGWAVAVFAGVAVSAALGDADGHLNPAFTLASVLMTGNAIPTGDVHPRASSRSVMRCDRGVDAI